MSISGFWIVWVNFFQREGYKREWHLIGQSTIYRLWSVAAYVAVDEAGHGALTEQLGTLLQTIDAKAPGSGVYEERIPDLATFMRTFATLDEQADDIRYGWTSRHVDGRQIFSQCNVLATPLKTNPRALEGAYPPFDGKSCMVSIGITMTPLRLVS